MLLTISYGIIQNHKGSISVDSNGSGCGATFTIRLPYKREQGIAVSFTFRQLVGQIEEFSPIAQVLLIH